MRVRFTKSFPSYLDATLWLYEHEFRSACIEIMQNNDVVVTLEGDDAKRARQEERPLAPGGFHLTVDGEAA